MMKKFHGKVSGSGLPVTRGRTVFATDMGPCRKLSQANATKVSKNSGMIRVGQTEKLAHGTLKCFREGDAVAVAVFKGKKIIGRKLMFAPDDPDLLEEGSGIPEAVFSIEADEFIGTPWHEYEYTSIWTVAGLRKDGKSEATVDK